MATKYADFLTPGVFYANDEGNEISAAGHVTATSVYPNQFWVQVGGKGVWFRVDFLVDLVKWAMMEGKVLKLQAAHEQGARHLIACQFSVAVWPGAPSTPNKKSTHHNTIPVPVRCTCMSGVECAVAAAKIAVVVQSANKAKLLTSATSYYYNLGSIS